jgi:hypothetical protein
MNLASYACPFGPAGRPRVRAHGQRDAASLRRGARLPSLRPAISATAHTRSSGCEREDTGAGGRGPMHVSTQPVIPFLRPALKSSRQVRRRSKDLTAPILVAHGDKDRCTSYPASKRFVSPCRNPPRDLRASRPGASPRLACAPTLLRLPCNGLAPRSYLVSSRCQAGVTRESPWLVGTPRLAPRSPPASPSRWTPCPAPTARSATWQVR